MFLHYSGFWVVKCVWVTLDFLLSQNSLAILLWPLAQKCIIFNITAITRYHFILFWLPLFVSPRQLCIQISEAKETSGSIKLKYRTNTFTTSKISSVLNMSFWLNAFICSHVVSWWAIWLEQCVKWPVSVYGARFYKIKTSGLGWWKLVWFGPSTFVCKDTMQIYSKGWCTEMHSTIIVRVLN